MALALLLAFPLIADEPTPPVSQEDQRTTLAVEALTRLQNVDLSQNAKLKEAVYKLLEKTRGTANYVKLVQYFKIPNQDRGLLDVALRNSTNETGVAAIRSILANNDFSVLAESLRGTNSDQARQTAELLGNATDKNSVKLLSPLVANQKLDVRVRREAVRSLAKTQEGAISVVNLAKAEKLPEDLKFVAASELNRARWPEIKQQASEVLPLPAGQNSQPLPSISELVKMKGDPSKGAQVFNNPAVACSTCHRVKGQGVDFGPDLSEIGTKLGKDALFEAILDPSAGISFGYEAFQIQLKSGDEAFGLLASETADEIAIKAVGGIVTRYKKAEVAKREQMKLSIMPAGLQQNMSTQELVDLVEYLASLKKL
jgi:putative heme-binding domain-containing protein